MVSQMKAAVARVGRKIDPPEVEGSGFKLLQRLGSTAGSRARVQWHSRGPKIDFYVRALD